MEAPGIRSFESTLPGLNPAMRRLPKPREIKGYPKTVPGGRVTLLYARYVRGNPAYGKNDFHDNGDGTITDLATGLMWQKADSGKGMNWLQSSRPLRLAAAQCQGTPEYCRLYSLTICHPIRSNLASIRC